MTVDVVGRQQALVGVVDVGRLEKAITDRKCGGHTSGEVGADQRACSASGVDEYRPIADVTILRSAVVEAVIGLRKSPQVVVRNGLGIPFADSHLVIESGTGVVPHLQEPVHPKPNLNGEIRVCGSGAHLIGEIANPSGHQSDSVAGGLDELQIVACVPPAA